MGYPAAMAVGTTLFAVIFTAVSGGYGHLVRKNLDVRATSLAGRMGHPWRALRIVALHSAAGRISILGLILGLAFLWPAIRMSCGGVQAVGYAAEPGRLHP
jgi:uncharacterized membrane protein YfcA